MRLYIPIGLPGSGKSTLARGLLSGAFKVATDDIRREMNGGAYLHRPELNAAVFEEFHRRIEHTLLFKGDCIADATNLKPEARKALLLIADTAAATTIYLVFKNVSQAIVRNGTRRGQTIHVPDEQMLVFIDQYEQALRDIPTEPVDFTIYIESTS